MAYAMVLLGLGIAKTDKLLHAIPLSFVDAFPACSIFLLGWVFPCLALPTTFVSLPVDYPVRSKWAGLSLTRDVCCGSSKLCYLSSWWRQSLRQRESLIAKATDSYRLRHLTVHVSNLLKKTVAYHALFSHPDEEGLWHFRFVTRCCSMTQNSLLKKSHCSLCHNDRISAIQPDGYQLWNEKWQRGRGHPMKTMLILQVGFLIEAYNEANEGWFIVGDIFRHQYVYKCYLIESAETRLQGDTDQDFDGTNQNTFTEAFTNIRIDRNWLDSNCWMNFLHWVSVSFTVNSIHDVQNLLSRLVIQFTWSS